jgi:membrane protease YdiL (CAAX protease family)
MNSISNLADRKPLLFVLILLISWTILGALTILQITAVSKIPVSNVLPQTAGTLIATLLILAVVHRLGWINAIGINSFGNWLSWIFTAVIGLYLAIASIYAFFGDIELDPRRLVVAHAEQSIFVSQIVGAFVEELFFRGIVLASLIRVWGKTRKGMLRAVIVQAILFNLPIIFQTFAGAPTLVAWIKVLGSVTSGLWLGLLVFITGTIWPAVLLHAIANISLIGAGMTISWAEPQALGYVYALLFDLPLVILGVWILMNTRRRKTNSGPARFLSSNIGQMIRSDTFGDAT